jgi:putative mRNA 3-end processing factor
MADLLVMTPDGLYCPQGDFYIDPTSPVPRAVVTHGHSDHARPGCGSYLAAATALPLLQERLGPQAAIQTLRYGEILSINRVRLSLHPAGHMLGSAQVRLEHDGQVWVVSGDYKLETEPSSEPFEPLRCHVFLTECTFGLPVYRWRPQAEVLAEIQAWWQANQAEGVTSLLVCYALGKAQRLLASLDAGAGPICVHGAARAFLPGYEAAGVRFPACHSAEAEAVRRFRGQALVLAPASSLGTPWYRALGPTATAVASGWMLLRGPRRRRAVDRGFPLSDHADWDGLQWAIRETGAERIGVLHGYTDVLCRWLKEQGYRSWEVSGGPRLAEDVG